jgi:uncharacterized tellurite resistance protein B-like protein
MSILDLLGFRRAAAREETGDTETVRKIIRELESLPPEKARYVAAFAFILARVAHADLDISEEETRRMEQILLGLGHLPVEQAVLAVQIAKAQHRLAGGTESFLVTREFKEVATREQCRELLDCLFAVSAADDSISAPEEAQIRQIASELGFALGEMVEIRSAWSHKRDVLKGFGKK